MRGDDIPPLPPIRTLSRDELAKEWAPDESSAASPSVARAASAIDKVLVALHLVSGKTSLEEARAAQDVSAAAAFYRREVKDVTLVLGTSQTPQQRMITLAHELTHYMQDDAGQLAVSHADNVSFDEAVARRALTEGEAVVTSNRMSVAMKGRDDRNVRWAALWAAAEEGAAAAAKASDSPLLAAGLNLRYVLGAPSIEALWEHGRVHVDELFDAPRLTGLDWLISPAARGQTHAERLDCYPPLAPAGYSLVAAESLGVSGLFALLATQGKASLRAVSEWRQDFLAIYSQDGEMSDPRALALWSIRFDSEQNAHQFASTLEPLWGADQGLTVSRHGRELTIRVNGEGDADAQQLLDPTSCPPLQALMDALPTRDSGTTGPMLSSRPWIR